VLKEGEGMNKEYRSLAEAIILQSIEDILNPKLFEEGKKFFTGDGFRIYGAIAELNSLKKYKIIHFTGGRKYGRAARVSGA
jgi:hypothetical protein